MTPARKRPAAARRLLLPVAAAGLLAACAEGVPPPPPRASADPVPPAPAPPPPPPPVLLPAGPETLPVRLTRGGPRASAKVTLRGAWRVVDGAGTTFEAPPGGDPVDFVLEGGAGRTGGIRLEGPRIRFLPPADGGFLLDGRPYAGELEATFADGGGPVLVNRVPVADYLAGVLAGEMPPGSGSEALRALAVLARSFALSHLAEGLTDDPGVHQAYAGRPESRARGPLLAAAASTEGMRLLGADGRPLPGYWYHSTCGGHTSPAGPVFGVPDHPAYAGVPCTWCTGSKYYRWDLEVPEGEMRKALRFGSPVVDLAVGSRGPHGRALTLRATAAGGTVKEVPAVAVRAALGPNRLRSTLLEEAGPVPSPGGRPESFRFRGRGWGHGVGLCQIGAFAQAERGMKAEEILAFYFPGARIERR